MWRSGGGAHRTCNPVARVKVCLNCMWVSALRASSCWYVCISAAAARRLLKLQHLVPLIKSTPIGWNFGHDFHSGNIQYIFTCSSNDNCWLLVIRSCQCKNKDDRSHQLTSPHTVHILFIGYVQLAAGTLRQHTRDVPHFPPVHVHFDHDKPLQLLHIPNVSGRHRAEYQPESLRVRAGLAMWSPRRIAGTSQ